MGNAPITFGGYGPLKVTTMGHRWFDIMQLVEKGQTVASFQCQNETWPNVFLHRWINAICHTEVQRYKTTYRVAGPTS